MTPAADLRGRLRGRVLAPSDDGYDAARAVWNGAVDRRPALIAACADVDDVVAAIRFARESGMPLSVRGGGHGVAGHAVCDDGLVVDLRDICGVEVDTGRRLVRAGGGVLNGQFDNATAQHGLATTAGIVSHTGLGGLALGGGIGWLDRLLGATCDNLTGAQLVTAEGTVLEADDDPELLWALRGAGANIGAVTRLDLHLHPVGPLVSAGVLVFAAEDAREVVQVYRDLARTAPREFGSILNLRHAPPAPWLPPALHGRPVLLVGICWTGDETPLARLLQPLREMRPLADTVRMRPYVEHQRLFDAAVPHGLHYYWRSDYVDDLTDGLLDAVLDGAWSMRNPRSYTIVFHLGGAMADVDPATSVFSGRSGYAVNINAVWAPPEPDDIRWVRAQWSALHPYSVGVYVNFLDDEGNERVRAAYGGATLERLRTLKRRVDPDNVFRSNHNIGPALETTPA